MNDVYTMSPHLEIRMDDAQKDGTVVGKKEDLRIPGSQQG